MKENMYKIKFIKMGKWATPTADAETWHTEECSKYFKNTFSLYKGSWAVANLEDGMTHIYFPQYFFDRLNKYLANVNKRDCKTLEKILLSFYKFRVIARKEIPKLTVKNFSKLSNKQLARLLDKNADWRHRVTVFDQFGWLAEEYWTPQLRKILKKYGIQEDMEEYYKVLFALTKPEEISTTLIEKRAVLEYAVEIKLKKSTIAKSAKKLAGKYGWMPVFTYGTPWDGKHYESELNDVTKNNLKKLQNDFQELQDYTNIRNRELSDIAKKYKFNERDLQTFIDFGLALDARNEAEYLVSLCGFYLLPIYKEIQKRLYLSTKQIRNLREVEIISALESKSDPLKVLEEKEGMFAWGFDHDGKMRFFLKGDEAKKFFNHLEKTVKNIQGNVEGVGVCASPGRVSGKAVVTHSPEENHKVKNGDILITHATTVDYLPAMKRAVAFVTEVGGLTCHAAVVAREFGVPCVVGLKNATKNFKDGDMVEVDATKGIVRKIK